MANKPTPADFSPTVPDFPEIGQYQPIYGKFDLTTYIQGASDYEIMSFLVQCYNATLKGYSDVTQLSKDTVTAYNQLQTWVNTWFDELDVQQEINNKLQSMYEAGTLATAIAQSNSIPPAVAQYLNSTEGTQNLSNVTAQKIEAMASSGALGTVINNTGTVQSTTTNWLQQNVTPTGSAVMVDNSLSIQGAAADSKTTGDNVYNANFNINGIFNNTDYAPALDGANVELIIKNSFVINTNGAVLEFTGANHDDYIVTDYIEVTPTAKANITCCAMYSNYYYAFYDRNKNFIEGVQHSSTITGEQNFAVRAPLNAKYLVASGYKTYKPSVALSKPCTLYKGSNFTSTLLGLDKLTISSNDVPFTINTASFISSTTKKPTAVLSGDVNYKISNYIDVSNFYALSLNTSECYASYFYAFYDAAFSFMTGKLDSSTTKPLEYADNLVIVPNGAKYIIISGYAKLPMSIKSVSKISLTPDALPWSGKKWTCVGDSLTEVNARTTKRYFDYVAEKTGITVVNMGKSGTGYMQTYRDYKAFKDRILDVPTDSDVVTIFGSGNDLGNPLGTVTDTGTDTLCGCINTTIDNLYSVMPVVRLGIVTPTPWINYPPSTKDNKMELYSNAIVEICRRRSIPCLDLYHCSNLRPWDSKFRTLAYSKDDGNGVHPDEVGHEIISAQFKNFVTRLIRY